MLQRSSICILVLIAAFLMSGCNGGETTDGPPARVTKKLATHTPVKLIKELGDFAQIETADSEVFYVDRSVLQSRSTAEAQQNGGHTHILSAATAAYVDVPPDTLPVTKPRAIDAIGNEQSTLNRLYMTEKTQRRIIAPTNLGRFVDEVTGENAWPVYECRNPDCPSRSLEEESYLFIFTDRGMMRICPECVTAFDLASKPHEQLIAYYRWTQPYVLEEAARRIKQLDAERRRAYKAKKKSEK
ncbi:MAG: hypothetical protein WBF93_11015 [Pirellulales bacterium]